MTYINNMRPFTGLATQQKLSELSCEILSLCPHMQHKLERLSDTTRLQIYSGDPMPRKICARCCLKLNSWFQFRKECIQTEEDLKKRLEPYKKIAFVKEYFDKYVKYEKSPQNGSLDSMSEYEDEDMDSYIDYMQREDDNTKRALNDNNRLLSGFSKVDSRWNPLKSSRKIIESTNQKIEKISSGWNELTLEKVTKSTNNSQKISLRSREQDREEIEEGKYYGKKDITSAKLTANAEIDSYSANKPVISKEKTTVSNINIGSSIEQHVKVADETGSKMCSDCGAQFHNDYAQHTCVILESSVESDDNDNFINPLSFVDTSFSEPTKESCELEDSGIVSNSASNILYKSDEEQGERQSTNTPWKCVVCSDYFNSIDDLQEHYNKTDSCSQAVTSMECTVCKCGFSTKEELVEHQAVHFGSGIKSRELWKCRGCDIEFETEAELKEHACSGMKETMGDLYCCKCDQAFADRELFDNHALTHNEEDPYSAIVTPQFTMFEGIEDMEDLADENEYGDDRKAPGVVRCFRCGRMFNSQEELEQHEFMKHKNPTPFCCRKCNLRFSARSQLLMHMRSHGKKSVPDNLSNKAEGDSSEFTCPVCNDKFFLQHDLQSHMKTHKMDYSRTQNSRKSPDAYDDNKIDLFAKFKCSVCSKIFVHSGSIIRHGKNLHKGQTVRALRLKRPIFLMKRARSWSFPGEKTLKIPQIPKPLALNNVVMTVHTQQTVQDDNYDAEMNAGDVGWDQDGEGSGKNDPTLELNGERCPFCERSFKPTYLPRHIKRNHRGEVVNPQTISHRLPDDSVTCRYCLKSCSTPHNRRVHESIHFPSRMQCTQCKICGRKFFNSEAYEIHILNCKSVRCVKCNKIFFKFISLKSHSCTVTVPTENKT